ARHQGPGTQTAPQELVQAGPEMAVKSRAYLADAVQFAFIEGSQDEAAKVPLTRRQEPDDGTLERVAALDLGPGVCARAWQGSARQPFRNPSFKALPTGCLKKRLAGASDSLGDHELSVTVCFHQRLQSSPPFRERLVEDRLVLLIEQVEDDERGGNRAGQ